MTLVATLVHGTWAPRAHWIEDDSPLVAEIRRSAETPIEIKRFHWSGWNRHSSRLRAAAALREHIRGCAAQYPNARQVLIAHSHGGNVALYALRDPETRALVHGLACLSSPFLHVRDRDLGRSGLWPIIAFLSVAIFYSAQWVGSKILPESSPHAHAAIGLLIASVPLLCTFLALRWLAYHITPDPEIPSYVSWLDRIDRTFKFPLLTETDLLIVRAGGDEASGFLAASQLISWVIGRTYNLISKAYQWAGKIIDFVDTLFELLKKRRKFWLCILAALWIPALSMVDLVENTLLKNLCLVAIVAPIATFLFLGVVLILALVGCVSIGALLLPISLLMCLALLPFGFEACVFSLFFEVTVEATPPGRWTLHQLPASGHAVPLWHSSTYTEPLAIEIICDWLKHHRALA